jgi:hypothetical protein
MKGILTGGASLLVVGVAAFAFSQSRRGAVAEAPEVVVETPVVAEPVVLADPGTIAAEPPAPEEPALPPGFEVDEDGFVWEPLSFDKPQVKNNGDGTFTMKKLARIVENGQTREVPITVNAAPSQRRLPIRQRTAPISAEEAAEQAQATAEAADESTSGG